MSLTIDDLLAREEIRDALNAYSQGLDQRNWKLFDRAFTPEATFTAPGEGIEEISVQGLKSRLQENNDGDRISGQHLLSNIHFEFDGDTARTISEVTWVTQQTMDKPNMVFQVIAGGMYVDDLIKTSEGWRIAKRTLVTKHKRTEGVYYPQSRIDGIRKHALNTNWFLGS